MRRKVTALSRMGLPYLCSPICRKGESTPHSMKLPAVVDHEETHRLPLIWPPNRIEMSNLTRASSSAGPSISRTWRIAVADKLGCAEHRRHIVQNIDLAGLRIRQAFVEKAHHRLGDGEVAGRHQAEIALARPVRKSAASGRSRCRRARHWCGCRRSSRARPSRGFRRSKSRFPSLVALTSLVPGCVIIDWRSGLRSRGR